MDEKPKKKIVKYKQAKKTPKRKKATKESIEITVPSQISNLNASTIESIVKAILGDKSNFGVNEVIVRGRRTKKTKKGQKMLRWAKHA